jgi:hypothetical protein
MVWQNLWQSYLPVKPSGRTLKLLSVDLEKHRLEGSGRRAAAANQFPQRQFYGPSLTAPKGECD